jgi:phosphonatase-like hydrolase
MSRRPDLVVFDFAGTMMRDDGAVLAAYRLALKRCGLAFTEAELSARRGASKRAVFEEFAARSVAADAVAPLAIKALASFEGALRAEYERGDVVEIVGASAAIAHLRRAGFRLALSSGFERDLVDLLVGRLGWNSAFDLVLSSSDVPAGRPAPFLIHRAMMDLRVQDVRRVAAVGDTPLDLQAAANAGAGWIIGVLTGAHGLATLGATPHTHLLASVAELPMLFGVAD